MTGLEPATSGVTGRCSNQLSYIPRRKRRPARGIYDYAPERERPVKRQGLPDGERIASLTPFACKG